MLSQTGRYTAADAVAERALQIDPSIPYVRSNKVQSTLDRRGDIGRARSLATELGLDPSEPAEASVLYDLAIFERDFDQAARIADGLPASDVFTAELQRLFLRGLARLLAEESPTSIGDSMLALDWRPMGSHGWQQLGEAYALSIKGDKQGAWTALEEAIRRARASDDAAASAAIRANATGLAPVIGRPGEALGLLDEIVELPGSFISAVDLRYWPAFDSLRDDPRFEEIVERRRAFEEQAARDAEADRPWLP
jgi:tetratricopeptide (TPR) repeat protein